MEYTQRYNELKSVFRNDTREIIIPGSQTRIFNTTFFSEKETGSGELFNSTDINIPENTVFSYPVFVPSDRNSSKVILLLHGLNERSWTKYLAWALSLSEMTQSYVILFPISFHINRSPEAWLNKANILGVLHDRETALGKSGMTSVANVTLSCRLTDDPGRFFCSGYQTVRDLTRLMSMIKDGKHEIIPAQSRVNVFAYSIGAFLSEIIFMANPENLFSESKLFLFCGGSVFSNMNGTSKLIMDDLAYRKLYSYYLNDFESEKHARGSFIDYLLSSRLGVAFRSMIDLERFRRFRETALKSIGEKIHTIALARDTVIPTSGILKTLSKEHVDVLDFPFPYTHENPFPVFASEMRHAVDRYFTEIFSEAASFLG